MWLILDGCEKHATKVKQMDALTWRSLGDCHDGYNNKA